MFVNIISFLTYIYIYIYIYIKFLTTDIVTVSELAPRVRGSFQDIDKHLQSWTPFGTE